MKRLKYFLLYHLMLFFNQIAFCTYLEASKQKTTDLLLLFSAYLLSGFGGYLINDFFDRKSDQLNKKPNLTYSLSKTSFYSLVILCWASATLLLYSFSHPAALLLQLEFLLLWLYSSFPIRLKEKGIWGVLTDTTYAHILPFLILLVSLQVYLFRLEVVLFLFSLSCLGVKDILEHQIVDRARDLNSGVITLATKNPKLSKKIIDVSNYSILAVLFIGLSFFLTQTDHLIPFSAIGVSLLTLSYFEYQTIGNVFKNNGLLRLYIYFSSAVYLVYFIEIGMYFHLFLILHPYLFQLFSRLFSLFRLSANVILYRIAKVFGIKLGD